MGPFVLILSLYVSPSNFMKLEAMYPDKAGCLVDYEYWTKENLHKPDMQVTVKALCKPYNKHMKK